MKKQALNKVLDGAKTKLAELKAKLPKMEEAAKTDNTRANRKALRRLHAAIINCEKRIAHLASEDVEKPYSYPKKTKTVNAPVKERKHKKERKVPKMAEPVVKNDKKNEAWEADKAARKAAKKAAPVFVKRVKPNKGMADATTEYLLEVLWEEYLNGNENAIVSIKELSNGGLDPEKTNKDMLSAEWKRINKAKKALEDLRYRWTRVNAHVEFRERRLAEATKMVATAKGMVTKAKKAYTEADENRKQEKYERMMERKRHLMAVLHIQTVRQQELARAIERMNEFADHWDSEEEYLKESIHRAYNKLDEVVIALRHRRTQEKLEDVFQQRYERGDRVISKDEQRKESFRYKMLSVKATTLFNWVVPMLEQLQRLADEKPAGWLLQGRALYRKIADMILAINGPMTVDIKDCQVNNVAASQMSDIMGVDYGANGPCKEMISVNYDITGVFKIYWKFIDEDFEAADRKLRRLREFILNHLIKDGVDMIDSEPDEKLRLFDELLFIILASNNSQQKNGQMTMGEQSVMEATEKFREFGMSQNDAIEHRPDNAAEWLKRNATMTTPSKVLKTADGRAIPMHRILMVDDVEIERMFDNVTTIDGKSDKTPKAKKLKLTMFDGQAVWLIDDMPSTQGRGAAMKFFVVAKPDYKLPEYATDIMGNRVRVEDYDILMTKSCWKAAKMGMNWYEFRDMCTELAKECPGYDLLRAVRYSDREIGDEENPRNMSRQAYQQVIKVDGSEVDGITRRTRRWLKNQKKYVNIVAELGEWYLPAEERSAFANLINRHPQIVMHPAIQQFLANAWYAKRNRACSGKLRVNGIYPYICQDPIAMIQICLEGRDPNAENLGVIPAGKVNLPKVKNGREVYCVRYPANYIVGMVVTQLNRPEFSNLGNVAVLSYYGDTITRADGDFDGDEMMFCFDKLIIELMKRTIQNFKPTLIDFPHGKVDCSKPFGTKERFCEEIAAALVRAQEFNLVGRYSNLAVICLQQASLATDAKTCGQWLTAAKVAHVGAIVCLDLVKGAEVPEELLALLKKMNTKIRDEHKMPWNQQFSHPELTGDDIDPRSRSTQDKIAGAIFDDVGDFEMDFDGEEPIVWLDSYVNELLPTCETRANKSAPFNPAMKSFVIDPEDARMLRGFKWEDEFDKTTWRKIDNGEAVGLKEFLTLVWHNASRIMWRMPGVDGAEKRSELNTVVRNIVMKHVLNNAWEDEGRSWTLVERYATTVKSIVCYMFGVGFDKEDGHMISNPHKIDADKMGSWTMFLGRVFGNDIVLASSDEMNEEMVKDACTPKIVVNDAMGEFLATLQDEGIDADELRCIMNDGCTSFSASDFDDEEYYPEINVA